MPQHFWQAVKNWTSCLCRLHIIESYSVLKTHSQYLKNSKSYAVRKASFFIFILFSYLLGLFRDRAAKINWYEGKFIFRSATSEAWLIVPPLKIQWQPCRDGAWTVRQQPCCSTDRNHVALWNEKFTTETLGQGSTAASQPEVYFLLTKAHLWAMRCASAVSIPAPGPPASTLWASVVVPHARLPLGQCCFWLEEAKIYDARLVMSLCASLYWAPTNWSGLSHSSSWADACLSDGFKRESSLLHLF